MHIAVLCATHRGYRFLERLTELASGDRFTVFSFREDPSEPPFLDDIRTLAEARGAAFREARKVGLAKHAPAWNAAPVDLLFAVSWRYMVPRHVYERISRGAWVMHDSLLPDKRGFSPTVWSIVNGEATTGATLFRMVEEVDAGDIVDQEAVPIGPDETIREVMDRVTGTYLRVLERNLDALRDRTAVTIPQNHDRATFTDRFRPEDACIDWSRPTGRIYDLIRGYTRPYPGAFTFLDGRKLFVWEASRDEGSPATGERVPGRVEEVRGDGGVVVRTGDGRLVVRRVQCEGSVAVDADRWVPGPGAVLGPRRPSSVSGN